MLNAVSIDFYFYKTFCFAACQKRQKFTRNGNLPVCLVSTFSGASFIRYITTVSLFPILLLLSVIPLSYAFPFLLLSRGENEQSVSCAHPPPWRITVHSYHQSNETTIHIKQARWASDPTNSPLCRICLHLEVMRRWVLDWIGLDWIELNWTIFNWKWLINGMCAVIGIFFWSNLMRCVVWNQLLCFYTFSLVQFLNCSF